MGRMTIVLVVFHVMILLHATMTTAAPQINQVNGTLEDVMNQGSNQSEVICEASTGHDCIYASPYSDGDCTFDDPCSIKSALPKLSAGDYLYLLDGVYTESYANYGVLAIINLDKYSKFSNPQPTKENPVTIKGYPGHNPIIQGDYTEPCIFIDGSSHIIIEDLTIEQCWQAGIMLQEDADVDDIIVRDNVIREIVCNDNMGAVYVNQADNVLIENNEFYDNYYEGKKDMLETPSCRGSSLIFFRATNLTVRNNTIHDSCSGMYYKHGEQEYGAGGYTKIDGNYWYDLNSPWCVGINQNRLNFQNNVVDGCGIMLYDEDGTMGPFLFNVNISHNTLVNSFIDLRAGGDSSINFHGAKNTTIDHNIFYNTDYNIWVYGSDEEYTEGINLISNDNCYSQAQVFNYFNNDNPAYGGENTGGSYSLVEWQELGYDANSIEANPMFVSDNDYLLQEGSPCSGMGAYRGALTEECTPVHAADNNPCDGSVSLTELIDYMEEWKAGQHTLVDVMGAIIAWKE